MQLSWSLVLAATASALSLPGKRQAPVAAAAPSVISKLVVGAPGSVLAIDFNSTDRRFRTVANLTAAGTNPSWMAFAPPNLLYAVDENSNNTRLFSVGLPSSPPPSWSS